MSAKAPYTCIRFCFEILIIWNVLIFHVDVLHINVVNLSGKERINRKVYDSRVCFNKLHFNYMGNWFKCFIPFYQFNITDVLHLVFLEISNVQIYWWTQMVWWNLPILVLQRFSLVLPSFFFVYVETFLKILLWFRTIFIFLLYHCAGRNVPWCEILRQ